VQAQDRYPFEGRWPGLRHISRTPSLLFSIS